MTTKTYDEMRGEWKLALADRDAKDQEIAHLKEALDESRDTTRFYSSEMRQWRARCTVFHDALISLVTGAWLTDTKLTADSLKCAIRVADEDAQKEVDRLKAEEKAVQAAYAAEAAEGTLAVQ